jgi:hypothetical protein
VSKCAFTIACDCAYQRRASTRICPNWYLGRRARDASIRECAVVRTTFLLLLGLMLLYLLVTNIWMLIEMLGR